jgi:thiosulfate dehydrogenase
LSAALAATGCKDAGARRTPAEVRADTPAKARAAQPTEVPAGRAAVELLPVPAESTVKDSALLAAIRRGRAILTATRDSLPANVGNDLRCTSCHLDDGRRAGAIPLVGVYASFPQYRSREGTVIGLEDRINGCLRRSMNGRALPLGHPALRDMVAYLAFVSRGVPVGGRVAGQGVPAIEPPLAGDSARGRARYAAACARCHGADGSGRQGVAPPLWGPRSFNVGAGLARLRTAAAFIKHNMPYDRPGTLTDQEAFDVAAWVVTRPRPDFPGKERDWPHGDAPPDAAYPTLAGRHAAAAPARGGRP